MASFTKHIDFLKDVWGFTDDTLDEYRDAAVSQMDNSPQLEDNFFVYNRFEAHKANGTDPAEILEELVALGPSVFTLFQMTVYLNCAGATTIAVPKKKIVLQQQQEVQPSVEAGSDDIQATGEGAAAVVAPDGTETANATERNQNADDNSEQPHNNCAETSKDDASPPTDAKPANDTHDGGNASDNAATTQDNGDITQEKEVPLSSGEGEAPSPNNADVDDDDGNTTTTPFAAQDISDVVLVDQCTLEMSIFAMWYHGLVQSQLCTARLMDPATVFVPLQIHNEIVLFFSVLRGLVENGCESIVLFTDRKISEQLEQERRLQEQHQQSLQQQQQQANVAPEQGEIATDNTHGEGEAAAAAQTEQPPQPSSPPHLTAKNLLLQVCYRYDVMDSRYWRAESTLLSMLIHTFRMCYALATNVDEVFQFSHGAVTLSLDRVLVEVLNFAVGMQFPECLYGLANQMLVHQTPRLLLRGRLITPYDLLAMIPISHAQVENPDSLAASRIIDARPRGRVHASCFMRSTTNSNHITDADIYWRRVIAASVFVFIGGIFVSRQANARFSFL